MARPARGLYRPIERPHNLLPAGLLGLGGLVADGAAGHRLLVRVEQSGVEQPPRHEADAPGAVQVGRDEAAAGLEVGQRRHAPAERIEVVHLERDADLTRDRDQMEHRVGRAARRQDRRDGVLDGFAGQDLLAA